MLEQHITENGDGQPSHLAVPMSDTADGGPVCTMSEGCGQKYALQQSFFKMTFEYTTNKTLDVSHCYGHLYVPEDKPLDQVIIKNVIF